MPSRASNLLLSLRRFLLGYVQKRLGSDPPRLRLVFWDGESFDLAQAPSVTIHLRSRQLVKHMLTGNMSRLGDAYASGDLAVDGPVEEICRQGPKLAERIGRTPLISRAARLRALIPRHHSRKKDAAAISYHYDLSNDFYRLWLDQSMMYSCAYFCTGTEDIDTAQTQKLEHICRKLRLATIFSTSGAAGAVFSALQLCTAGFGVPE